MGKVSATTGIDIDAPPAAVTVALADYARVRPGILPENYREYEVREGGVGTGTVVRWVFRATEKRSRDVLADVTVSGSVEDTWVLTEADRNSSLVTTYTVTPVGTGSRVETTTAWNGASGVGGFFERTFAPAGLKKVQAELLANLAKAVG